MSQSFENVKKCQHMIDVGDNHMEPIEKVWDDVIWGGSYGNVHEYMHLIQIMVDYMFYHDLGVQLIEKQ
jgi:hypothetical protein